MNDVGYFTYINGEEAFVYNLGTILRKKKLIRYYFPGCVIEVWE